MNQLKFHYLYNSLKIVLTLILLFTISMLGINPSLTANAQNQDDNWSHPLQISSSENYSDDGYIVSDPYGRLHLVWIEHEIDGGYSMILYAIMDESGWSSPVDIYTTSRNSGLDSLSLAIDQEGELHLVWTEAGIFRQRPVFYTHAPAHSTGSIRNWAPPQMIDVPAHLISLQTGPGGKILLLYSKYYEPQIGIYATDIIENGASWTQPVWIDPDIPLIHSPAALECASDGRGNYHILWAYITIEETVDWIRYASFTQSDGWSQPVTIDKDVEQNRRLRASGPRIAVWDQSVHVVWASELQRQHRYSTDGGQSWSVPAPFLNGLEGQAQDSIIVDVAGGIHYIAQLRFPRAIYHTRWLGDHWDIPKQAYFISATHSDSIGNRIHAHHIHATFRGGNQLVVTFTDPPSEPTRSLFIIQRYFSDIATNLPVNTPSPTKAETVIPLLMEKEGTPISTAIASLNTDTTYPAESSMPKPTSQDPTISIITGGFAAGLLILLVVVANLLRQKSNKI